MKEELQYQLWKKKKIKYSKSEIAFEQKSAGTLYEFLSKLKDAMGESDVTEISVDEDGTFCFWFADGGVHRCVSENGSLTMADISDTIEYLKGER